MTLAIEAVGLGSTPVLTVVTDLPAGLPADVLVERPERDAA